MSNGLYSTVIRYLEANEEGMDEAALAGLNDIHREMVKEYAEASNMTWLQAREHLHLPMPEGS